MAPHASMRDCGPWESDDPEEAGGPTQYDLLTYPADFTLEARHASQSRTCHSRIE